MSTKIERPVASNSSAMALATLVLLVASGITLADSGDEPRSSISKHHVAGGRDKPEEVKETTEEYGALETGGDQVGSDTRGMFAKPGAVRSSSFDYWIYEADVILFNDDDNDGYFHGIDLLFDVDTIYPVADVYAVLYLSLDGGPWNEYAVTEDFTLFGASGSDEYVLVSELMSGYPTGSYDLLIELFDAFDGTFLTSFGPADTSELAYLPLEDYNRDAYIEEVRVVSSRGGGGAMDGWLLSVFLIILFASAVRKIWRRRNDTLMRIDSPAPAWQSQVKEER